MQKDKRDWGGGRGRRIRCLGTSLHHGLRPRKVLCAVGPQLLLDGHTGAAGPPRQLMNRTFANTYAPIPTSSLIQEARSKGWDMKGWHWQWVGAQYVITHWPPRPPCWFSRCGRPPPVALAAAAAAAAAFAAADGGCGKAKAASPISLGGTPPMSASVRRVRSGSPSMRRFSCSTRICKPKRATPSRPRRRRWPILAGPSSCLRSSPSS
mmetsp:Transcript_43721/g.137303  ORF Transcript_43721/g.137303 Transcript_43721/m.137303 type:complete len:209 (+) Transcript_43721:463-1089(+)